MYRYFIAALLLSTCLLSSGCSIVSDRDERHPGIVIYENVMEEHLASRAIGAGSAMAELDDDFHLPALEAPDTVLAGRPFDVVVRTYGSSGCWSAAGADLKMQTMAAEIVPYDEIRQGAGVMCPAIVVRLPRTVSVTFPTPGAAMLRVTGRVLSHSDGRVIFDSLGHVEKEIVVVIGRSPDTRG